MALTIGIRKTGDVTILDLSGRITLGEGSPQLRKAIEDLLDHGVRHIILNMADVSYIDSSGVGELLSAYTGARHRGGLLVLLDLLKKVKDLLQLTKFYTVFDVFDDEATAVESFGLTRKCACPICSSPAAPGGEKGAIWPMQRCARCKLEFWVNVPDSSGWGNVHNLAMRTHVGERIELKVEKEYQVSIVGRLDIFCLSTLGRIWTKIPDGSSVSVDLGRVTEIEEEGWTALQSMLSGPDGLGKVAWLEEVPTHLMGTGTAPILVQDSSTKAFSGGREKYSWPVRVFG